MSYPGNPSLAGAVRDRVVSTFHQTLALYHQGRKDEVVAGCNLLLQMDPAFDPARKLLEKTRNPAAPIDVDNLLPRNTRDPMAQAREAMAARDFQRVIHLTTEVLTDDLMNDEARILGDEAREKLEAAPFIEQFTRKCDQHLAAGNLSGARSDIEKARALDATHPDVIRVSKAIAAKESAPSSSPTPSFVVDDRAQQATGRAAASASDFGFTFEEDKPPADSFANFSFDAGDFQQAIDLWSRIFLIDVTNDLASDRIERAKGKRREIESKVETLLGSAITSFDRRDMNRARAELTEVLRIDPNNATAHEYMERLNEPAAAVTDDFVPPALDDKLDIDFFDDDAAVGGDASLVPPDPDEIAPAATRGKKAAAAKAAKTAAPKTAKKLPMGALAALLAVLVLGGGGWFVWTRFMSKPDADPAATQSIFDRASTLAANGKFDAAIAILQDIKPDDPQHDKALEMIADLQQKKAKAGETIGGIPPEQFYTQKIEAAQAAMAANDFAGAKAAFDEARKVKPLTPDLQALYDRAADKVAKLDSAKALFAERKYADALTSLQPLLAEDPENQNIRRMINDAHFNLGATALQEERIPDAIREFDEVLKVDPNDDLAKRSRELATRYEGQPKDLLYKIYVKYLPLRQGA
jgi:tetratricopeptide (TPR) repeat protein